MWSNGITAFMLIFFRQFRGFTWTRNGASCANPKSPQQ